MNDVETKIGPIAQIRARQKDFAFDTGYYPHVLTLSAKTYNDIANHMETMNVANAIGVFLLPSDLAQILNVQFIFSGDARDGEVILSSSSDSCDTQFCVFLA